MPSVIHPGVKTLAQIGTINTRIILLSHLLDKLIALRMSFTSAPVQLLLTCILQGKGLALLIIFKVSLVRCVTDLEIFIIKPDP